MQHFCPHFSWAELKDLGLFLCTQKAYFSLILFTNPKTSQYLVWPPFASRSATHLLRIELIRLLIVACGMLVRSSSIAVRSCWILAGTGTHCRIRRSRASQICSMGNMSGDMSCFQHPGIVYRSLLGVDRLSAWPIIGADIKHFTDYRYRPF